MAEINLSKYGITGTQKSFVILLTKCCLKKKPKQTLKASKKVR